MFDYKLSSLLEESGFKAINSVSYESNDIDFLVVNPEEIRSHSTTGYLGLCNRYLAEIKGTTVHTLNVEIFSLSMTDEEIKSAKEKLGEYFNTVNVTTLVFNED